MAASACSIDRAFHAALHVRRIGLQHSTLLAHRQVPGLRQRKRNRQRQDQESKAQDGNGQFEELFHVPDEGRERERVAVSNRTDPV